jgi:hypothetical protein
MAAVISRGAAPSAGGVLAAIAALSSAGAGAGFSTRFSACRFDFETVKISLVVENEGFSDGLEGFSAWGAAFERVFSTCLLRVFFCLANGVGESVGALEGAICALFSGAVAMIVPTF